MPPQHRANPIPQTMDTVAGYPSTLKLYQIPASKFWQARAYVGGRIVKKSTKSESKAHAIKVAKREPRHASGEPWVVEADRPLGMKTGYAGHAHNSGNHAQQQSGSVHTMRYLHISAFHLLSKVIQFSPLLVVEPQPPGVFKSARVAVRPVVNVKVPKPIRICSDKIV